MSATTTTMYVYELTDDFPTAAVAVITGEDYEACYECFENSTYALGNDYACSTLNNNGEFYTTEDTEYLQA